MNSIPDDRKGEREKSVLLKLAAVVRDSPPFVFYFWTGGAQSGEV